MGEAKIKEAKRREQAAKIVAAFEDFINALICDTDNVLDDARANLIEVLVAPPPK